MSSRAIYALTAGQKPVVITNHFYMRPDIKESLCTQFFFWCILDEDQPYCFLYVPYALPVVQNRFMGIKPALAGIMYNFEEWWVPKSLQRYKVTP